MAKYLVTGGAGFIGSHIVEGLIKRNDEVRVYDDLSTGSVENLTPFGDAIEFVQGSITDLDSLRRAVEGIDFVFHEAALASVSRSVEDPLASHATCATGTLNVLVASRDAGVQRVVYAASSSAYGGLGGLPTTEGELTNTLSPYAAAKLAGEHYCQAFTEVYGLETVRLRYFNIFGPRQDPASPYSAVIPLFITAMLKGNSPTIYGDGEQSRDFTYIENVVQANLLAASSDGVAGRFYNIATGGRASLLDIVAQINQYLGTSITPNHDEPRAGDVKHSQADISRAVEELGYKPSVELSDGLQRSIEHYQSLT